MSILIIEDIVAGHGYREDDRSGELQRVFRVEGLPSASDISDSALRAVDGARLIPRAGDRHPRMANLIVRAVDLQPVTGARDKMRVVVRYVKVRRRLLNVAVTSTTTMIPTNFDKNGNIIVVGYKAGAAPDTKPPDDVREAKKQGWEFNYGQVPYAIQPETLLEITYLENASPVKNAGKYMGRVNAKEWQGGEKGEWLCESITGTIESPIPTNMAELGQPEVVTGKAKFDWVVTYRFRRRRNYHLQGERVIDGPGWRPMILFVDMSLNRSPSDINPRKGGWPTESRGNGWAFPEMRDEVDFDELKLVSADL